MFGKHAAGVFALLATSTVFAAEDPRTPVAVLPADVSHYDCAAAAGAAATKSLHIGQVILGRYYEWDEAYGGDAGQTLLCIGMRVPEARQLTATEAKTFLAQSGAIGAPNPNAAVQSAPSSNIEIQADTDAKPEPPKRVRKGAPISPGSDLPPVPAEHRPSDPNIPTVVPPAPEKPAAVPDQKAWEKDAAVDPRSEISATSIQSYPYNTIGYFTVTYPNNESYRCTGTLVSPYVVLTAGHCVQNNSRGGWVTAVRFSPAQYVSGGAIQRPYGSNTSWVNLKATQNWTQISGPEEFDVTDYRYDYAAIQFSQAFTHTSTFMPVVYGSTGSVANNAGYPGTLTSSSATQYGMYFDYGSETSDSVLSLRSMHVREFALYSSGGDSGSPFWYLDGSNRRALMGSLSYGSDDGSSSGGPWYDSWNQSLLASWVSWTPTSSPTASLPTSGLKAGAVFSSRQAASQSYLRFYNAGSGAGTVSVTLSDAATGTPLAQWTSPSIAPGASPQYAISTIETGANQTFTRPNFYSLAIQSGFTGSFQHVLWRTTDGSLTNLSTCDSLPTSAGATLMNVHSSLLQGAYPSQVVIFNTGAVAANATLGIYDAATGSRIGSYSAAGIPANGQVMTSVVNMENAAGITPGGRYHYNIRIENAFTGYLQHLVNNQSGVTTDMTGVCPLVRSAG